MNSRGTRAERLRAHGFFWPMAAVRLSIWSRRGKSGNQKTKAQINRSNPWLESLDWLPDQTLFARSVLTRIQSNRHRATPFEG